MSLTNRIINILKNKSFANNAVRAMSSYMRPIQIRALQQDFRISQHALRLRSTEANPDTTGYHNIIRNSEKAIGGADKHEFKAETRMLLDIVARSLYSENEVFIRELISNASDALEKFRYTIHTAGENEKNYQNIDRATEIHIGTDKQNMLLTIQDTGIGMTKEELINNLGTIARSGSKQFLDQIKEKDAANDNASNIIGQFGVGFYSAFMVANKVEVYTRSSAVDSVGLRWSLDLDKNNSGAYEIQEADGVSFGTKIVIHLKPECREYADEDRIKAVIKKYSNFVGSPIFLNGKLANDIKPVWLLEPKEVTQEQHTEFYRFIGNTFDAPRFVLHYKTDVPISIRALLYFPSGKPGLFDLTREGDIGVALYTRKVLIQSKTRNLIPKWLRFIKGVVDSEDIPLNLSRELLQNSSLIKKISNVITSRVLKYLHTCANKQATDYEAFYKDYGIFLKEGIVTSNDQEEKQNIAKLLRFDSSKLPDGKRISLEDYCKNIGDRKDIYYLAAPNRILAESSPYFEDLKKRDVEVLFCYEPYDELVLLQLSKFNGKNLVSVEKEMRQEESNDNILDFGEGSLPRSQLDELLPWVREQLAGKVTNVKVTTRLDSHPCVVTVEEMAAARHFIRTQSHQIPESSRFALLQPQLEINPKHEIIKKLNKLRTSDTVLAKLLIDQLFANAIVGAGLAEDPRMLLTSLNELLVKALEKY